MNTAAMTLTSASSLASVTITGTLILLAGAVDDLRSRKFHNWLFITLTVTSLALALLSGPLWSALNGFVLGFIAGFLLFLPLVATHVVGAGDLKLLAALGSAIGWSAVIDVAVLSLVWGAVFGLLQVILKGELLTVLKNMAAISKMQDRKKLTLHTIPFSIAIFFAWLTHLVQVGAFR